MPRSWFALLCCLFVAAPFLFVTFPPITDLPQQSAQIRLFLEALHDPSGSPYKIQWFTPYSLSYLMLGISWAFFGGQNAGRIAMLAIAILWVISIHLTASRRDRSTAAATLACLFILNHMVYWGFYSFEIGWPAFLIWFSLNAEGSSERFSLRDAILWLGCALLLYTSHVLWFMAGVAWLALRGIVFRRPVKETLIRLAYVAPLVVVAWIWYPSFAGSSMATPPLWALGPISRLSFSWLSDAALGGIKGPTESFFFTAALAWVLVSVVQHRKNLKSALDMELLLAACLFFVLALLLPDKYMNTIRFGQRWMPPAMIMLLLAVPAPIVRPLLRQVAALILVAAFSVTTTAAWVRFEKRELSGLKEALASLPSSPKVLGLDLVQKSDLITGHPFIQVFAYSQVLKGGTLNFSFAEFSPCLVVFKKEFAKPWTHGLEWFPGLVQESDLQYFDYVLINGTDQIHAASMAQSRLTPVTKEGRWRLYRVKAPQK
ncbi:MAG: hypothetical protein ACLP5H_00310 [Desulfomonilaceae bacterium]